jgi:preprotein translocase subunit SecD
MPYDDATRAATPVGTLKSCEGGRLVTRAATAGSQVILADRDKKNCYALGPTLLTGANVERADPVMNPVTNAWEVNVHFNNDDFVQKVAKPEVLKQVAIVLDGVVQSAPMINPGITGRDVTISGAFDEPTARHIAAELRSP